MLGNVGRHANRWSPGVGLDICKGRMQRDRDGSASSQAEAHVVPFDCAGVVPEGDVSAAAALERDRLALLKVILESREVDNVGDW